MLSRAPDNEVLLEYLFGELPEPELSRVQELCFVDERLYERLSVLEGRLIDRYVQKTLPESERRDFEEKYLVTPSRRKKVAEAEQLIALILDHPDPPPDPSLWKSLLAFLNNRNLSLQVALAFALVLMTLGCLWLFRDKARLGREVERTQASLREKEAELQRQSEEHRKTSGQLQESLRNEQASREQEAQQLEELQERVRRAEVARQNDNPRSAPAGVAVYIFPLVSVRGIQSQKQLVIRRGEATARLVIYLESNDYKQYRISIQRVSGEEVWSGIVPKGRVTSAGERVSFGLPAGVFTKKDYILVVDGMKPDGVYSNLYTRSFSVVNENVRRD
jgi:hypothetical protein